MVRQQKPSPPAPQGDQGRGVPTPRSVGWNLRLGRRRRRLTLYDVAEGAGITAGALSRIETGRKSPSLETLVKICEVAGIGIGEVFRRPEVWVGPPIDPPGRKQKPAGLVRLSRPGESRVGVFHGELPPGRSGLLRGPAKGGLVAVTAKAGVFLIGHGERHHTLRPGDALTVMAPGRISWTNDGTETACALWVYTPSPMPAESRLLDLSSRRS